MSFTCPDCIMTSFNPNDAQHLFCGRCHEFKTYNLRLTLFQDELITAARSRHDAFSLLVRVIAQHRMFGMLLTEMYVQIDRLLLASKLDGHTAQRLFDAQELLVRVKPTILSSPDQPVE